MTEPQATPAPVKNKGGRPRGSKTRKPVHDGPHFKDDGRVIITRNGQTYEYISGDEPDRLHVPASMIPDGMVYLWVTDSILGQVQPQWRTRRERTGWRPVPAKRHDGLFMPKGHEGEINVDGLVLCEKPIEFVERDRLKMKRAAAEQVWVRERAMMSGDAVDGVAFDTTSDKGRKANRIGKTYEQIPVPGNSYQRDD
jgi:hypothetical protein